MKPHTQNDGMKEPGLWGAFDDEPPTLFDPPLSGPLSSTSTGDNEDMWNILDKMEQGEWSKYLYPG